MQNGSDQAARSEAIDQVLEAVGDERASLTLALSLMDQAAPGYTLVGITTRGADGGAIGEAIALSGGKSRRLKPSDAAFPWPSAIDASSVPATQRDKWGEPEGERSAFHLACRGARLVAALGIVWEDDERPRANDMKQLAKVAAKVAPLVAASVAVVESDPRIAQRGGGMAIDPTRLNSLTGRQREIVLLLAEGRDNDGIAERLQISRDTVKTILRRVYRKIGASGRVALLRWLAGRPPVLGDETEEAPKKKAPRKKAS